MYKWTIQVVGYCNKIVGVGGLAAVKDFQDKPSLL